jgi:PTS system nitrogen regulatory IIA component
VLKKSGGFYMTLSELLKPELIRPKILCSSKDDFITKLMDCICKTNRKFIYSQEEMLASVFKREQIGGTTFPSGLAVPHSRIGDFDDFVFALGTPLNPIFHEGIQIRLMVLMLSNQSGGPYYFPTVAALTKISMDSEYFPALCEAESPEEFIKIIQAKDLYLS